jgi:molybdenum cofactor biosynthesis enzyme MoaA
MDFSFFNSIVGNHPQTRFVGVGGGEPLLHPDFERMMAVLFEAGKTVVMSSNMFRNTEKLEWFYGMSADRFTLQASIPAADKELYERITGVDALEEVEQNLDIINGHLSMLVNCVVYKGNLSTVPETIDYVHDRLGLPVRISLGYPAGNARDLDVLSCSDVADLARMISAKRVEGKRVISAIRFKDSSCTEVYIPCTLYAAAFGAGENVCACEEDETYYNARGKQSRCEFEGE